MTDFRDDKGIPGSWGEYFAAINGLSVMMQSGKFQNFEEVLAAINALNTSNDSKYNALAALINTHISNQNNSDHKLNSFDVNKGLVDNLATAAASQTGTDFDGLFTTPANAAAYIAMVAGLTTGDDVHKQNINPISTYGDKTWLPVNVTQSYAGATAVSAHSPEVNMVEDNSSYMGIHAGTNGVTKGLYYHYLVDAARREDKTAVMNTHHKYTPKGLISGEATSLISTDGQCIVGRISGGATNGFVSITKGDLNPANHRTAFINIPFTEDHDTFSTACVANGDVYLFRGPVSTSGNNNKGLTTAHEFIVYRIQVSAQAEGSTVAVTQVNGWATTGLYGLYNGNTIRIANCMTSPNVSDRPLMLHNNSAWLSSVDPLNCNMRARAEVNPANSNQIRLGIYHTAKATTINGETAYGFMAYSLLLTFGTSPTAVMEDGGTYVTVNSGSVNAITLSSTSMVNPRNVIGIDRMVGWANTCISRAGYVLTRYNDLIKNNNCTYTKSEIVGFSSKFAALRYKTLSLNTVVSSPITVDTETDMTTNITNPRSMPGNYVMMNGLGRTQPNQGNYSRGKRVSVPGTPTVTYPTVNSGDLLGWTNSLGVSDYSTDRTFNQSIFISRCNARDTIMTCDASVMYRGGTGGGLVIDQNGAITGVFAYTASEAEKVVFDALKLITSRTDIFQYDWVIYASQDANIPLTVVAGYTIPNGDGYRGGHVMFELNYTGSRAGVVTGYTYKKLCKHETYNNTGKAVWLDVETMGGYQHYSTDTNDRLVSVGCPVVIQGLSTDPNIIGLRRDIGIIFFAAIRSTALGTFENSTIKTFVHDNYPGGETPSGIVNSTIGLGVVNYVKNNENYNTFMLVSSMAFTYAQFVSWSVLNEYVMTSQKKTTNSTFKFYCDEPVFMAGREYTVAKKTMSLTSVTPAPNGNTFYIGMAVTDNVADYDISLTPIDGSISYMPLGTIVVDGNGVSTVTLRKPIRVDIYEMQKYRRGMGIPHTVGSAVGAGKFHWLSEVFNGVSFTYYDTAGDAHSAYSPNFDIAYVQMNYNLNTALSNVTITIDKDDGVDEEYFLFKIPGNHWGVKTISAVTNTIPVGGALRIDIAINDDHSVAKHITTALKVTLRFGEVQYIAHTDKLGYTLKDTDTAITKHVASGRLQPRASTRIKFGGGGNGFAWDLAPVQHGGAGFPTGTAPNGISITMPLPYDNPQEVTAVTPFNSNPNSVETYVFQRAGNASSNNIVSCALNMDLGDGIHAKVITPNPVNGLPWFDNAGPIVELKNVTNTATDFKMLVGNMVGQPPISVTRRLKEWALEHYPSWWRDDEAYLDFEIEVDTWNTITVNMRTGLITTYLCAGSTASYTLDYHTFPSGATYTPGLWVRRECRSQVDTLPELAIPGIVNASNISVRVEKYSGRNGPYISQHPNSGNDYNVVIVNDDNSPKSSWRYSGKLFVTLNDSLSTRLVDNIAVEVTSIVKGDGTQNPIDEIWRYTLTNNNTTAVTNVMVNCVIGVTDRIDESDKADDITFSTAMTPNDVENVYQIVTSNDRTVTIPAGGSVTFDLPVYGNKIRANGVTSLSQYNDDIYMTVKLTLGGNDAYTRTPNHHVEYTNKAGQADISLRDLEQPSPDSGDTVWTFQFESLSGEPMLGAIVTYERIVDPTGGVNDGITFNNTPGSGGVQVGDYNYAVETIKTMTLDIGTTSTPQTFTLYGNAKLTSGTGGALTPVDDKYNVWLGMRVTVTYGSDTSVLLFPNQYRVVTDGTL